MHEGFHALRSLHCYRGFFLDSFLVADFLAGLLLPADFFVAAFLAGVFAVFFLGAAFLVAAFLRGVVFRRGVLLARGDFLARGALSALPPPTRASSSA